VSFPVGHQSDWHCLPFSGFCPFLSFPYLIWPPVPELTFYFSQHHLLQTSLPYGRYPERVHPSTSIRPPFLLLNFFFFFLMQLLKNDSLQVSSFFDKNPVVSLHSLTDRVWGSFVRPFLAKTPFPRKACGEAPPSGQGTFS